MKVLFNTKSIVGRVAIVSLLAGGLVFAGMFSVNTFVPTPVVASSCCASAEQGATSDDVSSESEGCCAKEGSTINAENCSKCSYSTCPGSSCTCNNDKKIAGARLGILTLVSVVKYVSGAAIVAMLGPVHATREVSTSSTLS